MSTFSIHQPHHDGSELYVSNPSPSLGETVSVFVRVPHACAVDSVHVRVTPDGEQQFVPATVDRADETETWWRADIVCRNPVTNYRFILEGGATGYAWLNGAGVHGRDVPDAADFRLTAFPAPPRWSTDAIVYQIFPDRFARSVDRTPPAWASPAAWTDPVDTSLERIGSQWYGGDLDGVRAHLDDIVELGANVLYLTPFFPGGSNHRYDASTFDRVDPFLGGDPALAALVEAAHQRGLRVLGDLTTNHTGDGHEWFSRALADPDSPERDFYYFDDAGDYASWLGVRSLPKLNFTSPELRKQFFDPVDGVVARWVGRHGLDGWRIDVANMTGRHGMDDLNADVARQTRTAMVTANPQALLVAEHAHDYTRDALGDGWHGVMNYAGFTKPVWTWLRSPEHTANFLGSPLPVPRLGAEAMAATMRDFTAHAPWRTIAHSFNLLGSHDTTRIRTLLGESTGLGEVAAGLLFTMPGIPMLTYGDEIGMTGEFAEDGRKPYPWDRHDVDEELRSTYQRLAAVRAASTALRHGGLRWVHAQGDVAIFLRESATERVLVHCARAPHPPVRIDLSPLGAATAEPLYGTAPRISNGTAEFRAHGPAVNITSLPTR
ncbi:glycoside hydrolase family 13 protein [Tessaracoccus sp. Y1736]